jgi:hypothetical protein
LVQAGAGDDNNDDCDGVNDYNDNEDNDDGVDDNNDNDGVNDDNDSDKDACAWIVTMALMTTTATSSNQVLQNPRNL